MKMARLSFGSVLLLALLLTYVAVMAASMTIDPPFFLVDLFSRALYVDEGYYADAAQNLVKFGQWVFPHDNQVWPGAPFLSVLQAAVFSVFGADISTARLISIVGSAVGVWALYLLCRMRFGVGLSLLIALAALVNFNYVGYSRSALTEPTAGVLTMLAALFYARSPNKNWAIFLSLLFAYFAFLAKIYFLFVLLSVLALWAFEIFLLPLAHRARFKPKQAAVYIIITLTIITSYLVYMWLFSAELEEYLALNNHQSATLHWGYVASKFAQAGDQIIFSTKSPVLIAVLILVTGYFLFSRTLPARLERLRDDVGKLNRADWIMGAILVSGFMVTAMLGVHKGQYDYFAILPLLYISVSMLGLLFESITATSLIAGILVVHMLTQIPWYQRWLDRPNNTRIHDTAAEVVKLIETAVPEEERIVVFGEYSQILSLHGSRIFSVGDNWISNAERCARAEHYQPHYHINVVWPGEKYFSQMRDRIVDCPGGAIRYEEVMRYTTMEKTGDEIVLTRFIYE